MTLDTERAPQRDARGRGKYITAAVLIAFVLGVFLLTIAKRM